MTSIRIRILVDDLTGALDMAVASGRLTFIVLGSMASRDTAWQQVGQTRSALSLQMSDVGR